MSSWALTWNVSPFLLPGTLRWFTLLFWVELAVGYWCISRQVRRGGGDEEDAADLAVHLWIGLVVGARLGHVLFYDLDHLVADPMWVLRIWSGGLGSHGGVLGAWLAIRLFARRRAMHEIEVCDRLTYTTGVFAVVHRIANLFNSEVVGKPTDGSWGVRFPRYDLHTYAPFRHPSQLYEVALGLALLLALFIADRLSGGEKRPRGLLTGIALVGYFTGRFAVEFFKEPQGPLWLGVNTGQLLSVPFIVVGALIWRSAVRRPKGAGWRVPEPAVE